ELTSLTKKMGAGYLIQRYKGLGEMNADQLWETTMDPDTRTLIRVSIEDSAQAEKRVSVLMGNKVEPRRKWIESNVEFSLEEDGSILENNQVTAEIDTDSSGEKEESAVYGEESSDPGTNA